MEIVGTEVPRDAEGKAKPKPVGQWIGRGLVDYDPERHDLPSPKDTTAHPFDIRTEDYVKRFAIRKAALEGVVPQVDAVMQTPTIFREGGKWRWRLKPTVIRGSVGLFQEYCEASPMKWALESSGDPFELGDSYSSSGTSATSLIDANEFIPFLNGPFYKQLYQYDYLSMHARAFELVNHNALAAGANKILTRFVIGRGISFTIKDPACKQVWDEFWERNKMREKARQMARDLCLDAETRIACLDGTNPTIAELARRGISAKAPLWVYSYDATSGRVVPGKATKCWKQPARKRCVEVTLDSGEPIVASFNHPFLMRDGRYVWAERLQSGDSLMPLYRKVRKNQKHEVVQHPGVAGRSWQATHYAVLGLPIGQTVGPDFHSHHLNENKRDNRPENVGTLPRRRHAGLHAAARWADLEKREQMRRAQTRTRSTPEGREQQRQNALAAWRISARQRQQRLARTRRALQAPEVRQRLSEANIRAWQNPLVRARRIAGIIRAKQRATVANHTVASVQPAGDRIVYDLQVEKYHNFALAAGVFTHNTWQGELFHHFVEKVDGFVTMRMWDPSTVWEVVTDPEDFDHVYYYHRQFPTPYQLWTSGTIPISKYIIQQVPPTQVQHIKINISSQEKRGRSDLLPAMPWLKRFNDFYNGTVVKAMLEANLVYIVKVHGDQNDVNTIAADPNFTTLPPPGGMWIENEAVELKPISSQLTAGRGSSGIGQQLAAIIATSLNLPSEYFNIESGGAARATALVRTDPAVKTIEDRQQTLKETLEDIYDRVIEAAIRAGRLSPEKARHEPEQRSEPGELEPDDAEQDSPTPVRAVFRG